MKTSQKFLKLLLLVLCVLATPASGWTYSEADLMALSLEELTRLEVTSVSRKSQKVSEAAAAVFVITQQDIRRSGVTSIPEALRMAPGLTVARIDGSKWAISSRGFNGRFANKLLVLIDGRSVYSQLFSGVYWDVQDTLLDDVERIEVIRGPGATLWGANAVNGVINVITKKARDTQGTLLKAGYGTEEEGFAALRYGGKAGDRSYYRAFVKYFNRDHLDSYGGGSANDDWNAFRGGFRLDVTPGHRDEFTLQGEVYSGTEGQQDQIYVWDPLLNYQSTPVSDTKFSGGHLLARWQRQLNETDDFVLQAYFDHSYRDEEVLLKETRDIFDIDFQHRFDLGKRHELFWGLGYRLTTDDLESAEIVMVEDEARSDQLFSFFFQDEMTLLPDKLRLLVGSKFEHNDYTGFEYQPNARLIWTPNSRQSLWGSVSRAVRTPSRLEDSGDIFYRLIPPMGGNPFPTKLVVYGQDSYESEKSLSYELGYRYLPGGGFSIDTALFYTDYWDHRSGEALDPFPVGTFPFYDYWLAGYAEDNKLEAKNWGLEMSVDWRVRDWWRLQGNYTLLKVNLGAESGSSDDFSDLVYEDSSPQQQWSLRSSFDLGRNWELDLWLRYVDRITVTYTEIDDYYGLDMRLAWQPTEGVELALIGQNLLESNHQEFQTEMGTIPTAVPRGFYGQVKWQF
ncbi:TonB-dependent receptor plug domain-containing protein [Syntrophotalea acetylenivorans]|uniref:TonB-dependent receptor plug domain-containing protein n=1 Tax=Syntrophotalea acetylenivorans TaxID=1842532 RepID=UPI000AC61D25|nr:TonB-dependent receptor [Syntrophotalea acetylenivorans]